MRYKQFNATGRLRAEQIVKRLERNGRRARIREVWFDRDAKTTIENIQIYNDEQDYWYQALTPRMIDDLNAGRTFDLDNLHGH